MRMKSVLMAATAAGSLLVVGVTSAQAQTPQASSTGDFLTSADFNTVIYGRRNNVSVRERPRPEYEALGVRQGGFLVYPKVEVTAGWTDNIFAVENNPQDDTFVNVDPSITIQSQWSVHAVRASAGLRHREVLENDSESQTGYFAAVDGRYDATPYLTVTGRAGGNRRFEDRGSTNSPTGTLEPIEVTALNSGSTVTLQRGRVRALGAVDYASFDYKDAAAVGGGTVDQDFRDQSVLRATGRGEYSISPDTALLGVVSYTKTDYDVDTPLLNRDSDEVRGLVGANFDLTALMRGEVGVGYISREYDNPAFGSLDGFAALARLEYFPTQLVTLSASVRRAIDDSTTPGSGGFFTNSATLTADYELLRNVIVGGRLDYRLDEFEGLDREDRTLGATVGAQYLVNRNVGLGATVSYTDRASDGAFAGPQYDAVRLMFSVVFQR